MCVCVCVCARECVCVCVLLYMCVCIAIYISWQTVVEGDKKDSFSIATTQRYKGGH